AVMSGFRTTPDATAEVTSAVSTPNINIHEVAGGAVAAGTGGTSASTIRTVEADDGPLVVAVEAPIHAEDEAYTAADFGNAAMTVRKDARAQVGSAADGDYVPAQTTATGDLRVRDDDLNTDLDTIVPVVHNEDEAYTAADAGIPTLVVRKDARAQAGSAADGDYVPLQTTANGDLRTKDDDANTVLGTIDTDTGNIATATAAAAADLNELTAAPIEKTPILVTQFVAAASTAEALIGSETFARVLHLQARKVDGDNTGNV
ncbi:unnamed protein product, partial [marine sediment metagenome]